MTAQPDTERRRLASLAASHAHAAMSRYQFLRPTLKNKIPLAQMLSDASASKRTVRRWLAETHHSCS